MNAFGLVAAIVALLASAPARAEWQADLYGGGAYTPRSDITLLVGSSTGPADHTFHQVKWTTSAEYGARAGYWFDAYPWYGVGLDLFHFNANIPAQTVDTTIQNVTAPATLQAIDVSVTALALDIVRLRYKATLQPYASAGPAVFRVRVTNKGNTELTNDAATDTSVGYKIGAGLSWQFAKRAAIFGEYRYTHVQTEPVLRGTITGSAVPMRFNLSTQHAVAGLSFAF